jgi:hypothetical protein
MAWIDTFNDVFWISVATITFSFFGVVLKSCLKSKCDNTNICWGLVKIHRRVELEDDVEMNTSVKKTDSKVGAGTD